MARTKAASPAAGPPQLTMLALDQLHPSPANPRRDVGDVAELAASIKELGVVEPLIVTPTDDGYVLVAGHRRHAAATAAGVSEVPCIVRPNLDDRAQAELRLVENLHRQDLAPIEEAVAYQELVELGCSQRALAKKISRSQAHISRRLSLLKLPAKAMDALDSGGITVEQATTLARVPSEKVAALFKRGAPRDYEVTHLVRRQEREETLAAARKALKESGVTVLDDLPGPAWKHALRGPATYGLGLTPEDHAGEPCHAAVVSDKYGRAVDNGGAAYVCTNPDRHAPDGDSGLKVPARVEEEDEDDEDLDPADRAARDAHRAAAEARRAAEEERAGQRREAIEARRAYVKDVAANLDAVGAVELTALLYTHCFYVEDPFDRAVAEQLGIAADTFAGSTPAQQIAAYTAKGSRNRTRAVATAAAVLFETMVTPNQWQLAAERCELVNEEDETAARAWLAWLVGQGYELSDHDRELIPAPEPPAEPAPGEAVAWYDDPEDGPRWVGAGEASAIEALDAARLYYLPGQPSAAELEDLGVSLAVQDGVRAMKDELDAKDAEIDAPPGSTDPAVAITVTKKGRRWTASCSACGELGSNTTEVYADERGQAHLDMDHRLVEAEAEGVPA